MGKNENGIAKAIRPKLKFDTSGVGHKDVEFQWWNSVYDKALKNIKIGDHCDKIEIKTESKNAFNISSSPSGIIGTIKNKHNLQYGNFLKTSTLQDGQVTRDNSCELMDENTRDDIIIKMSDEELFKACGGRTAHKGARHGLTLNGKLARIAEQERQLLASQFLKSNDESSQSTEVKQRKKKKKKKDKSMEVESCTTMRKDDRMTDDDDGLVGCFLGVADEDYKLSKKTIRRKTRKVADLTHQLTKSMILDDSIEADDEKSSDTPKTKGKTKKKKSKRKRDQDTIDSDTNEIQDNEDEPMEPFVKKSKKRDNQITETVTALIHHDASTDCIQNNYVAADYLQDNSKFSIEDDHSSECYKSLSDADRLNLRIWLKKKAKVERKMNTKLEKLSERLNNVSLNSNLLGGKKTKACSKCIKKKLHKKNKKIKMKQ